jgi:hypothetical protein
MIFDQAIVDWIPVNYKDSWRLHDTLTGFFFSSSNIENNETFYPCFYKNL